MKHITHLDYMILKNIPVYPEERSRGDIVRLIKAEMPVRYKNLTTACFDAVLLKYTNMFLLAEDKDVCPYVLFEELENDADCMQCTLSSIPLDWVYEHIGMALEDEPDFAYLELIGKRKPPKTKPEWYKQSSICL